MKEPHTFIDERGRSEYTGMWVWKSLDALKRGPFSRIERENYIRRGSIKESISGTSYDADETIAKLLNKTIHDIWPHRYIEQKELVAMDIENAKRNVDHPGFPFKSGEGWPDQSIIDKILSLGKPLRIVEAENGLQAGSIRQTIKNRNVSVDHMISELIGVDLQELWPYRYVPDKKYPGCYRSAKTSEIRSACHQA